MFRNRILWPLCSFAIVFAITLVSLFAVLYLEAKYSEMVLRGISRADLIAGHLPKQNLAINILFLVLMTELGPILGILCSLIVSKYHQLFSRRLLSSSLLMTIVSPIIIISLSFLNR